MGLTILPGESLNFREPLWFIGVCHLDTTHCRKALTVVMDNTQCAEACFSVENRNDATSNSSAACFAKMFAFP